jgi:hypothetical protein
MLVVPSSAHRLASCPFPGVSVSSQAPRWLFLHVPPDGQRQAERPHSRPALTYRTYVRAPASADDCKPYARWVAA